MEYRFTEETRVENVAVVDDVAGNIATS